MLVLGTRLARDMSLPAWSYVSNTHRHIILAV